MTSYEIVPERVVSCCFHERNGAWRIRFVMKKPQLKRLSENVYDCVGFGGHLGRKGDGDEELKIWKGLLRLADYLEAAQAVNGK